ncbi:hypothetical protein MMC18_008144, partial [Xylographa bjoerkii]|nr:hypothetical protein [Xylographa bjoerkii]
MTTLVVVTTSFPQSPPDSDNAVFSERGRFAPPNWAAPKDCKRIGAHNCHDELRHKLVKRNSQLPQNDTAALELRSLVLYPCGNLIDGWQSDGFAFLTAVPVIMEWTIGFGIEAFVGETVRIMQHNPAGGDQLVQEVSVNQWQSTVIRPV